MTKRWASVREIVAPAFQFVPIEGEPNERRGLSVVGDQMRGQRRFFCRPSSPACRGTKSIQSFAPTTSGAQEAHRSQRTTPTLLMSPSPLGKIPRACPRAYGSMNHAQRPAKLHCRSISTESGTPRPECARQSAAPLRFSLCALWRNQPQTGSTNTVGALANRQDCLSRPASATKLCTPFIRRARSGDETGPSIAIGSQDT